MSLTAGKCAAALENLLKSRSRENVAWHELAEAIALAEQASSSAEEAASLREFAVTASGYSAGLINRYLATYARIKKISADGGPEMGDMFAPAFNTVEAAVKLFELDRGKGLDAFRRLKDGTLTLSTVRSELTDAKVHATDRGPTKLLVSGITGLKFRSKDVRRRRQSIIVSALQRGYAPLFGQYEEMTWHEKDSFLEGEGVYRIRRSTPIDPSKEDHYGLETVVMAAEGGPRFVDTILPSSIVRARCFLQYHLAFWSDEPMDQIDRAVSLLDALEEETIGIVSVGKDGWIKKHREPTAIANPHTVAKLQEMLSLIAEHGTLEKST
jgi:hypothetical protein